jgi:hypothetical protein
MGFKGKKLPVKKPKKKRVQKKKWWIVKIKINNCCVFIFNKYYSLHDFLQNKYDFFFIKYWSHCLHNLKLRISSLFYYNRYKTILHYSKTSPCCCYFILFSHIISLKKINQIFLKLFFFMRFWY